MVTEQTEHKKDENDMDVDDVDYYSRKEQELEQKISELETECSRKINDYKERLNKSEDQVKEISEKYNQSEVSLGALRTEYLEINNSLTAQLKEFIDKQTNNSNEIRYLKEQLESLSTENKRLKEVQFDYEIICNENNDLEIQLSSYRTEIKKLKNKQKIDSNEISKLKEQLESLSSENERLNKEQTNLSTTLRTESANLKKVTDDYEVMCGEHGKLKIHLENEKLKNKNSKQNNHSNVYNDYANLKVQMKDCKKDLSKLRSEKEILTNKLAESVAENKKLKDKITTSSKSPDNYSAIRNENDKLNKPNEEEIRQLKNKNEEHVKEINKLNNLLQKREKEKQEIMEKNANLKKEASQYQSALGTITNYRMDDDDKNHSVHLKRDIEELQNKLKNYVTTLKGDCEIDFGKVNGLMEEYNIKTKITPKQPNKPLIRAVLQYHIIKKITSDVKEYFKQNLEEGSIANLEAEIASKAKDLENKLAYFSNTRSGTDTVTQAASIKIRQEVNIALGNRGFSDFLSGENYVSHGYIMVKKSELNEEMNKYRTIKDDTKKNYVERLAPDLIREFIRIIHFRLKVQEPSAQVRWVKIGSNIDPSIMEGSWDKDDIDNLEVEICSFPMIGRDLNDVEKRKIYTHAQVFTKKTKRKNFTSFFASWGHRKVNLEPGSDDDLCNEIE